MATSTSLEVTPTQRYSIRDVLLARHGASDTICITAYKKVDGETKATDHFCAGVDEAASLIERGYEREDIIAIWSNLQRLKSGSVKRKKGETIDRYTNLLIDIDRRVKSVHVDGSPCPHSKSEQKECGGYRCNATESERKVLFEVANEVAEFLRRFGNGSFADSGNGYHLSWRLGGLDGEGLEVETGQNLYKRLLALLKAKFERPDLNMEIDASLADETQVVTVWGTWNRKYPNTPERPQRQSQALSIPTYRPEDWKAGWYPHQVSASQIEEFLLANPVSEGADRGDIPSAKRRQDKSKADPEWLENYGVPDLIEFWLPEISYEGDSYDRNGEEHHPITPYPCHDGEEFHEHSHKRHCEIIVFPDGGIGISCFSGDLSLKQIIKKMNEIKGEKYPHLVFAEESDAEIAAAFGSGRGRRV